MDNKQKLTLDQPVTYQIQVPGHLDEGWARLGWEMTIRVESRADGLPVSTLTGAFDQAALQGLLRRLYSMGLPLISVNWIELC
jgi:hypothetical protein